MSPSPAVPLSDERWYRFRTQDGLYLSRTEHGIACTTTEPRDATSFFTQEECREEARKLGLDFDGACLVPINFFGAEQNPVIPLDAIPAALPTA